MTTPAWFLPAGKRWSIVAMANFNAFRQSCCQTPCIQGLKKQSCVKMCCLPSNDPRKLQSRAHQARSITVRDCRVGGSLTRLHQLSRGGPSPIPDHGRSLACHLLATRRRPEKGPPSKGPERPSSPTAMSAPTMPDFTQDAARAHGSSVQRMVRAHGRIEDKP